MPKKQARVSGASVAGRSMPKEALLTAVRFYSGKVSEEQRIAMALKGLS